MWPVRRSRSAATSAGAGSVPVSMAFWKPSGVRTCSPIACARYPATGSVKATGAPAYRAFSCAISADSGLQRGQVRGQACGEVGGVGGLELREGRLRGLRHPGHRARVVPHVRVGGGGQPEQLLDGDHLASWRSGMPRAGASMKSS